MGTMPSVAVIGAGLGGLAAGIKMKEAGVSDLVMLEKDTKVGGTWRDNTYPGCACDVPVALYQYSFAPYFEWSHLFPRWNEIQRYTESLADNFGLRPHLKMGDEAVKAVWNEGTGRWRITTRAGQSYESQFLIAALGQLNRPMIPAIAGIDQFKGNQFHSARWDHSVPLERRRVGVIGSAASAVQLIPEVAKQAGHLTVFQRTPNYLLPRNDRAITPEEKVLMMTDPEAALSLGAMNRQMIYQNADHFFWQAFAYTPEGRAAFTRTARDHLEAQVSDPELRRKLTPDYPIGCKRILYCDDFYPTLMRPNVSLVTDAIVRITPNGVETNDKRHHDFDVLVYATGFETTEWHWSLEVIGQGGRSLKQVWGAEPQAYLGLTVAGFPNMAILYGPNTNLGHNSITFMLECQIGYAVQMAKALSERKLKAIAVRPDAQQRFNSDLQKQLQHTTWADPHCRSWYKNEAGHITQNWSSHTRDYAKATQSVVWADYETQSWPQAAE